MKILQIKNGEIVLSLTPIGCIDNSAEYPFYSVCYDLQVDFEAEGIRYSRIWQCYVGELNKFEADLIAMRNSNCCAQAVLAPRSEAGSLAIEKTVVPYEAYSLTFRLPASLHSDITINGQSVLDQSYINIIIAGVNEIRSFGV